MPPWFSRPRALVAVLLIAAAGLAAVWAFVSTRPSTAMNRPTAEDLGERGSSFGPRDAGALARAVDVLANRVSQIQAGQVALLRRYEGMEEHLRTRGISPSSTTSAAPSGSPTASLTSDSPSSDTRGGESEDEPAAGALAPRERRPSPDELLAQTREYEGRLVSRREEQLAAEPVDEAWRWAMEADLRRSLADAGMGTPHVTRVRCASTMCALNLSFADQQAVENFILGTRGTDPWQGLGELFVRRESYDDLDVEVYASRSGHPFRPAFE